MTSEPRWLVSARAEIGTKEIPGKKHNPKVLQYWLQMRAPFTDDETPWCAGFVGAMLEKNGIKSSRSAMARSYSNYGQKLSGPIVGCIVVMARAGSPGSGHVGFYVGKDGRGNMMILGGNQGDAVNIKPFPLSRAVGFRWPAGEPMTTVAPERFDTDEPVSRRESFFDSSIDSDEETGNETSVVTVDSTSDERQEQIEESAEKDAEPRVSWIRRKWRGLTGWTSGFGGVGILGYLTDPWVIVAIAAVVVVLVVLFVWFMGPGSVRAWVRKQVA